MPEKPQWWDIVKSFDIDVKERGRDQLRSEPPSGRTLHAVVRKTSYQPRVRCQTCGTGIVDIEGPLVSAIAKRKADFQEEWVPCAGRVGDRPCFKVHRVAGTITY